MPEKQTKERAATTQADQNAADEQKRRRLTTVLGPITIVIILAAFWLPQVISDAAATVNGETISRSELDKRVAFERLWSEWSGRTVPTGGREAAQFRAGVLDQLIENRIVMQEARKAGVTVTAQDVADQVTAIQEQLGLSSAQLDGELARAGLTRPYLESVMREDALIEKFLRMVVVAGVAEQEQQAAVRNWYNNVLAKARIEKKIESGGAKVGESAPDFSLNDLEGKPVRLSDLRGKAVFINFWATWCNPCRAEMPDIEAVWQTYRDRGLVVLAINLTNQDDINDVTSFVKELGLTFPVLLDTQGSVASLYRVGPIPSSYFVSPQGVLSAVQVGAMSRGTMEQRIARILP